MNMIDFDNTKINLHREPYYHKRITKKALKIYKNGNNSDFDNKHFYRVEIYLFILK